MTQHGLLHLLVLRRRSQRHAWESMHTGKERLRIVRIDTQLLATTIQWLILSQQVGKEVVILLRIKRCISCCEDDRIHTEQTTSKAHTTTTTQRESSPADSGTRSEINLHEPVLGIS